MKDKDFSVRNCISLLMIFTFWTMFSCGSSHKLVGLWQIEQVKMGEEEMTPIARWARINKDHSQEAGNGWYQHSVGRWNYNNRQIEFITENGIKDEFGAFEVESISKESMVWKREEEGEIVEILLKRIYKTPQSPADQLLGMWKLMDEVEEGQASFMFFRWDHILIDRKSGEKRQYAMYKTHGHKAEIQIIYYEDPLREAIWNYRFSSDGKLILEGNQDGAEISLEYERIDYFPK